MENDDILFDTDINIKQKTIAGIGWTSFTQVAQHLIQFVIIVVLARILTPEEFGLIGMITVFTGFAAMFGSLGFSSALIQKKSISEYHYSSVFWLNIIVGLILTIIIIGTSPLISKFYNEPRLKTMTILIGFTFIINAFGITQKTRLYRDMKFNKLAFIELLSIACAGLTALILALYGFGVWSLVWQAISLASIRTILFWIKSSWRPKPIFNRRAIKDLLGFSSNMLGVYILRYWIKNADKILIGKFFGSNMLGIYNRAVGIMLLPQREINLVLSRVMFPAFSRIQHDKDKIKRIYLKSISIISLITFPMMIGLFIVSDHFILAVYGSKWAGVIPILRIFCFAGLIQSITSTTGWIYQSQGRAGWMFRWSFISGIILVGSIVVGIQIGSLEAVAICYTITIGVILLFPEFTIPGKLINMRFVDVIKSVAGSFICTFIMGIGLINVKEWLPINWPHWKLLIVLIAFGIITYFLEIHFFKIRAYVELKKMLIEQIKLNYPKKFKTR